jgi:hypothetical protein
VERRRSHKVYDKSAISERLRADIKLDLIIIIIIIIIRGPGNPVRIESLWKRVLRVVLWNFSLPSINTMFARGGEFDIGHDSEVVVGATVTLL